MSWMLAVDFGTSNTAAAVRRGDDVRPLHLSGQGFTMPSAVALVDGGFRVGTAALNARLSSPETFEWQPKSLIGTGTVLLGDRTLPPAALVTEVLKHVYSTAMTRGGDGHPPSRTVLTHPVAWADRQIAELADAAVAAGFDRQRMVVMNEPVAAAMRYATDDLTVGDRVAVIDWGGGTCDVAIVEYVGARSGSAFVVRSYSGDPHLGGNHLDGRLFDHVVQRLRDEGHADLVDRLNEPARLSARLTLADVVKRAKEDLSTYDSVTIPVQAGGDEATLTVTREEYEGLIAGEIRRVTELLDQAVERDNGARLDRILLTGGTSQTPALARALEQSVGVPLEHRGDPKLVVAEGALVAQIPPAQRTAPPAPPKPSPSPAVAGPAHPSNPFAPPQGSQARASSPAPAQQPRTAYASSPTAAQPTVAEGESGRGAAAVVAAAIGVVLIVGLLVFGAYQLWGGGSTGGPSGSPTTDAPQVCWNGEEPNDEGACPDFQGDAAQAWTFPVDEYSGAECEFAGRVWDCRWDDYPSAAFEVENNNGISLSEDQIRSDARTIMGEDVDVTITERSSLALGEEDIGQRWQVDGSVDGVPALRMTYYEYTDIPYRGRLYTKAGQRSLTTSEQTAHDTLVQDRNIGIRMRPPAEIEQALTGSVR